MLTRLNGFMASCCLAKINNVITCLLIIRQLIDYGIGCGQLAREEGVGAAIAYARAQFPAHAARHERQLQAAVCALAWCTPGAPPAPHHYHHLLDPKALGELDVFIVCGASTFFTAEV